MNWNVLVSLLLDVSFILSSVAAEKKLNVLQSSMSDLDNTIHGIRFIDFSMYAS